MDTPSRRRILNGIAALAVVPIAGEDKHSAYAAIEAFEYADADLRGALERVQSLRDMLKTAEADLAVLNKRYDVAAIEVCRVLRLILQRPV